MRCSVLFILFIVCAGMFVGLSGCDSEDDSGDPAEPGWSIAYTADTQNPPPNSVYLDFITTSGDDLFLSVNVREVENVFGVAFALHFDPAVFEYINSTEGDFFKSSGAESAYIAAGGDGVVTIGISILGAETSPVSGSGTLCSLVFRAVDSGRSRFDYRENHLFDGSGDPIPDVQWFGGLGIVAD